MIEQLDMFADIIDITDATTTYQPPAGVRPDQHGTTTGYAYGCRCAPCRQAAKAAHARTYAGLRLCHQCGTEYPRNQGGRKFCEECIDSGVYARGYGGYRPAVSCERCNNKYKPKLNARWQLCGECTQHPVFLVMQSTLGKHKAPIHLVIAAMADPHCANQACRADIMQRVHAKRIDKSSTRYVYNFAVDHDHACCPGNNSCGQCIRGILCRACNSALPHTINHAKAQGLATYLAQWERT